MERTDDEEGTTEDRKRASATPPRSRRRLGTLLLVAGAFLLGSLTSGVGAVWASHQFSDVPASHPFHDDIDWMVDNGITNGYADGTFQPTGAVSRQAVAAFFRRYNDTVGTPVTSSSDPPAGTSFAQVAMCPVGTRVLSGGGTTNQGGLVMTDDRPHNVGQQEGWYVRWIPWNAGTADPTEIRAFAICAPE